MRRLWSKAFRFRKAFRQLTGTALALLLAAPAFAQGASPWENAVSVLQQAFTSTIARGLSLVAIVVSGLTFVFGEGGSKRVLAVPDLRIEYEIRAGDIARVNLELVTEHYRGRHVADKVHAGFSLYTPHGEADHLRRVLDQHELTAEILSL
jgi:type IV secretory pathway VirB2 component (pilin)